MRQIVGSSPFLLTVAIKHGWGWRWRIPAWWQTGATEHVTIVCWRGIDISYIAVMSVSVSEIAVHIRSVGGCNGKCTSRAFSGKVSVGPEIGDTNMITQIVFGNRKRCTNVVPCNRSRAWIGARRNRSRRESLFQAWCRGDIYAGRYGRLAQAVLQGGRGRRLQEPLFQWYNASRALVSHKFGWTGAPIVPCSCPSEWDSISNWTSMVLGE